MFDSSTDAPLSYVDPRMIVRFMDVSHVDQGILDSVLKTEINTVVSDGDWDLQALTPVEEMDVYRGFHDHYTESKPWEETAFYKRVIRQIESGEKKWSCTSDKQFRNRLEGTLHNLYMDIKNNGFKAQHEIPDRDDKTLACKYPADEVRVAVSRDGEIVAMDGRHRLAIAKLLGLGRIPVRIVLRHPDWLAFVREVEAYAENNNGAIYQQINHPDLYHIPATHREDRFDILVKSIRGYKIEGKKLLDIGCHWGFMSHNFSLLGFDCTAVESADQAAYFATRISSAYGNRVQVTQQSVFDYPDVEKANVVVVLNILHHFLKTKSGHRQLIQLLKRMQSADIILYQAHEANPHGQMKDAYRNYNEAECVAFLKKHTEFSYSRSLGRANDGRMMFVLFRHWYDPFKYTLARLLGK